MDHLLIVTIEQAVEPEQLSAPPLHIFGARVIIFAERGLILADQLPGYRFGFLSRANREGYGSAFDLIPHPKKPRAFPRDHFGFCDDVSSHLCFLQ
jgi:hypothetical protein